MFGLEISESVPESHLRQPGITYSACGQFSDFGRIQKFRKTGNLKNIYKI